MKVVITDLDGTLLDCDTYSWEPAKPALKLLQDEDVPLVFCSSKTRAEVEEWRRQMGNRHPFIVENGGALFVPHEYFPFKPWFSRSVSSYDVVEFGAKYETLVEALREAADATGCRVRGFADLSADEIAERCGLPIDQARWAKQREYDETFEVVEGNSSMLLREIERMGFRWLRGGRFLHITGNADKGLAVMLLMRLYYQVHRSVMSIGLGDSANDAEFLSAVDVPLIVRSKGADSLKRRVPRGTVTEEAGPRGWNTAILQMVP